MKMMQQDGITPLTGDELQQLIPPSILTREQLNQWEQVNIQEAVQWAFAKHRKHTMLATQQFIVDLHRKMFGQVWKWAGQFRTTNKNIGVDNNTFANLKICCFGNEVRFPETQVTQRFREIRFAPFPKQLSNWRRYWIS